MTAKDFSPKGKVVYSIEESLKEIYGVVDTLEKGGELGTYEKQKEFMDSSTKGMDFGKMIAFTFSQSTKTHVSKSSAYFRKQVAEEYNTKLKETLGVAAPLNNPVSRNRYTVAVDRQAEALKRNVAAQGA
ncbi:MAG: hypothetical protein LBP53_08425 [Candidatus Peribacteria bacterium]|nr:hypothetical protein [Candidatus Peribacteria bacterium]